MWRIHKKSGSQPERKSVRYIIAIASLFVELIENTPKYIFYLTHNTFLGKSELISLEFLSESSSFVKTAGFVENTFLSIFE